MQPVVIINGHNYTRRVAEIKPVINDVDADGSGRDTTDALMWRSRQARKWKWSLTFLRLSAEEVVQLHADMDADYLHITMLDPETNTQKEKEYYNSTINYGIQRYVGDKTVYDGVAFNITER